MRARGWAVLAAGLALACAIPARAGEQTWSLQERKGEFQLRMERRSPGQHLSYSSDVDVRDLAGFDPRSLSGLRKPVRFEIARDAGRGVFEGTAGLGRASGTYTWIPDEAYAREVERLVGTRIQPNVHLYLWESDVGLDDIRESDALIRGRPSLEQVRSLADRGARASRLRAMREAGLGETTGESLLRLIDHGVGTADITALRTLRGTVPDPDELVALHDHGVPAKTVLEFQGLGYGKVPAADLVRLHDHGVEPAYIRGFQEIGYRDLAVEDLIRLHDHGVTADYARRMLQVVEKRPSVSLLIRLKDHGFDG